MKYICEHCRNQVTDSQNFCHECGSQLEQINDQRGKRFYVDDSQKLYDAGGYDKDKIAEAVKKAGGSDITFENKFGWSNQPEVVVFSIDANKVDSVIEEIANVYNISTLGIVVSEKDW